ncbi:serine hydrolase [Ferruginibacter sp. HRS2-29]|uniref:serine hydrolase domain-containing protein n=1 Tax=Ferruginibacter sp. HRS2-29 TaxID=2487334 RepID=UPI0020CEAEF0|nr:serine hydrolase domain-containing protein [Ferruginibacter sp. HRS2-29]MCP9751964.1 class A beta-lactamase-related serine hydrolase [Ferruginibacter sp. HRS2-29]
MKKLILLLNLIILSGTVFSQNQSQRIDSLVTRYSDNSEFTGTVLVASDGKILLKKGFNYRDAEKKIPNDATSIFNIASLTKTFTAALILKLEESKKLSVTDKLSKYYADFPNGDKITIHHLLTHTSGLSNYTDDPDFQKMDQSKEVTLSAMILFFKNKPLDFEPGTKFRYSNSGYTMLGYIIEKITGESYALALKHLIFQPHDMQNTTYGPPVIQTPKLAQGYNMYFKNFQMPAYKVHPSISYSTGAIYSTVEDLYKWHQALQKGKFLSLSSLKLAYQKDAGPYGYGWFTDSLYNKQRVSHDGNINGYKSNINRFPADDVCVIALSNSNNSSVGGLVRNIVNIIYHQPLSKPFSSQPVITMTDTLKKEYQGVYKVNLKDSAGIAVTLKQSKLSVKIFGQSDFEIFPVAKDRFKSGEIRAEFIRNNQGKVEQLFIYSNGEFLGVKKTDF